MNAYLIEDDHHRNEGRWGEAEESKDLQIRREANLTRVIRFEEQMDDIGNGRQVLGEIGDRCKLTRRTRICSCGALRRPLEDA
ncbi:hypothetical protein HPP92_015176 [Vanilla planifolia]|uniref:Uncharacterized protein n=1 Tax=Vanilla planifolia TaxID=51239 RepID=A0A835URT1_VANPL|nr:hypothetical protein HPP92_015176 [Vanilla planifolia]